MRSDGHLNDTGEDNVSGSNNTWRERLMTTIWLGKVGAVVFLVCWDEELVIGKDDGEVLMVSWRHARVVGD